ncbi:MAG: ribonuclease HI [Alphaproteobacteria bacterium]|nr:ribonuclease HI [Alphaproteobacteria bacterium]
MTVRVYTDGACSGNPGPGGWGAVLIFEDGTITELSGRAENTTNNKMELTAAIKSLEFFTEKTSVEIFTDSTYVKNGITQWIKNWEKNNWKNSAKQDVKNRELWEQLSELAKRHQVSWNWVKGHDGDKFNEMADKLASGR